MPDRLETSRGPEKIFRPRKRFGQNFLVDRGVLSAIVERAAVMPNDVLLEVGPGRGVLTEELLRAGCARLYAVEVDLRLQDRLEPLRARCPQLELIWGDAVCVDYGLFEPFPNKAVANIPYNITTPLIWRLLTFASRGLTYHLYMVQKEAADRLTAPRDTKERYPLGAALEVMGKTTLVRKVPSQCFRPAPRVESALVEIVLERGFYLMDDPFWPALLHAGFRQRRKTLLNNLKGFAGAEDWRSLLDAAAIDLRTRAEDLSGEEWLCLYNAFQFHAL
ncbi:MAG: 16S rRNA (adenine(1518)-N(6)/adenine(1519)-N(6))-dimethyltransferase RsmA [Synergistaceae bacterium]|nr:16S rRNA (adenine(1518)-N(6)/adenine(1519)-N(6))-dimethyltransferase RsmA [Synergistaceae bacterium]